MLTPDDFDEEQELAIDALYGGNVLLIAPKGAGKAVMGQTAAQELLEDRVLKRVLVVAPLRVCQLVWAYEYQKWSHLHIVGLAIGNARQRRAIIESEHRIVVINFENLKWLLENGLHTSFDGLLVDELGKLKTSGGVTFKRLRHALKRFAWRCGMNATPAAESGVDLYAQMMIIDRGKALGTRKHKFLETYAYPEDWNRRNWAILPERREALMKAIAPSVHLYDGTEYEATLPEIRDATVYVPMSKAADKAYRDMAETMAVELDGTEIEAASQGVVTQKLQQITAGAMYTDEKRTEWHWLHSQKLDMAVNLAEASDGPVMLAYNFQFELRALLDRLHTAGLTYAQLGGKTDAALVQASWNGGGLDVLLVHPKAASHGLNLQYGGYELIITTPPWGADPWSQLIGRIRRRGQPSSFVRRTVIAVRDSVDDVILDKHLMKGERARTLMGHLEKWKRRAA